MTERLADPAEELFRQVHPGWVVRGRLTSQVFKPTPKDEGRVSVDRSSKIHPQESLNRHVAQGFASVAVIAVTVGEVEEHGAVAFDDPQLPLKPAHAVIDMTGLTRSVRETAAAMLRTAAVKRGARYPPGFDLE